MPIYYLSVGPEKLKAIVYQGKHLKVVSGTVESEILTCVQTPQACLKGDNLNLHQTFILELNIPMEEKESQVFPVLNLREITTSWINGIFVYSKRGENLTRNLLKESKLTINLKPDFFALPQNIETQNVDKRKLHLNFFPEERLEPPSKRQKIKKFVVSKENKSESKETKNEEKIVQTEHFHRLSSTEDHISFLKKVIAGAKQSILITSYGIHPSAFVDSNPAASLFALLVDAANRKVRIYIYYNDQKPLDTEILNFFTLHKINFSETYTHSKLLVIDNQIIAAGSFNWLSNTRNNNLPSCQEGSLVYQGKFCHSLSENFWKYLKKYRRQQFLDAKDSPFNVLAALNKEDKVVYTINPLSRIVYLPTLKQHRNFFQNCFERARKRLIICSPFISSNRAYEQDFNYSCLSKATSRGVNIYFICQQGSDNLQAFEEFIGKMKNPNLHVLALSHIHLKTIMIDEYIIADGSFNWLSASRFDTDEHHNHEQTLYVEGDAAKPLIDNFFQNPVGLILLEYIFSQSEVIKENSSSSNNSSSSSSSSSQSLFSKVTSFFGNMFSFDNEDSSKPTSNSKFNFSRKS